MKRKQKRKRNMLQSFLLFLSTLVAVTSAVLLYVFYTKPGKKITAKVAAWYIHGAVNYVPATQRSKTEEVSEKTPEAEQTNESEKTYEEEEVYHILLLGEEAIGSRVDHGRTDAILLVSVIPKQRRCVVTSILRDIYIEQQNEKPGKLNSIYAADGVAGLYRLLYDKLSIWPYGYVKIGFSEFEEVIDLLGGVSVTLTQEEAEYLQTHNYISKEENRNVKAGTHLLNGNQVLGYCRVRYVPNCNGTKYDYGRTERQRMVLKNLFERYKKAGITDYLPILRKALSCLETDLSEEKLTTLIYAFYENKVDQLTGRQLPAKGTYETPESFHGVTSPLVIDWKENKRLFQDEIN